MRGCDMRMRGAGRERVAVVEEPICADLQYCLNKVMKEFTKNKNKIGNLQTKYEFRGAYRGADPLDLHHDMHHDLHHIVHIVVQIVVHIHISNQNVDMHMYMHHNMHIMVHIVVHIVVRIVLICTVICTTCLCVLVDNSKVDDQIMFFSLQRIALLCENCVGVKLDQLYFQVPQHPQPQYSI